jgi:hypothetical protein
MMLDRTGEQENRREDALHGGDGVDGGPPAGFEFNVHCLAARVAVG